MYHRYLILIAILSGSAAAFLYPDGMLSKPVASLTMSDALRLAEVALLVIVALFFFVGGIYSWMGRRYWKLIEAQMQKRNNKGKNKDTTNNVSEQEVSNCHNSMPRSTD
jgi:hypothetical protein